MEAKELKLPLNVVGRSDITRMLRELDKLDDFFVAAASRGTDSPSSPPPRITRVLDQLARDNRINLLEAHQRKQFAVQLKDILSKAPALNISFAAEPSPTALEKVLSWFRQNIHPQTLLQIGLQPSIAAGCVLRTPNQIFDMSISRRLQTQEPYLAKLIDGAVSGSK